MYIELIVYKQLINMCWYMWKISISYDALFLIVSYIPPSRKKRRGGGGKKKVRGEQKYIINYKETQVFIFIT